MKKGERTKQHIIQISAELFNRQGYSGSSMNDMIAATGIKKGGLYRHFGSKEEIALEGFNYAAGIIGSAFTQAVEQEESASGRLLAFFKVYEDVVHNPPFPGGCPLLNMAVESDDTNPKLRQRAHQSMTEVLDWMKRIIEEGIHSGEFRSDVDADSLATFALSLLEGGIMMSKLEGDNRHMRMNAASFSSYLRQCCNRK